MDNYIGTNIKNARIKAGYTQESLAEQVDVSLSVISRLETGRTMVSVAKLLQIAEVLNTFAGYFFIEPKYIARVNELLGNESSDQSPESNNYPEIEESVFLEAAQKNLTHYVTETAGGDQPVTDKELYQLIEQLPEKSKEFFKKTLLCYLEIF